MLTGFGKNLSQLAYLAVCTVRDHPRSELDLVYSRMLLGVLTILSIMSVYALLTQCVSYPSPSIIFASCLTLKCMFWLAGEKGGYSPPQSSWA